jgi:hypothetical protein
MKAFTSLLYLLIAIPVLALAAVLCIPILVFLLLKAAWFRYSNRGKVFLVYTRRHGWNDFVSNNLIPAFVNNIEPVEYPRGRTPFPWQLPHIHAAGQSKPYFAIVSWRGVRYIALHELLLPLKQYRARRLEVQAQLRDMLARHVG